MNANCIDRFAAIVNDTKYLRIRNGVEVLSPNSSLHTTPGEGQNMLELRSILYIWPLQGFRLCAMWESCKQQCYMTRHIYSSESSNTNRVVPSVGSRKESIFWSASSAAPVDRSRVLNMGIPQTAPNAVRPLPSPCHDRR